MGPGAVFLYSALTAGLFKGYGYLSDWLTGGKSDVALKREIIKANKEAERTFASYMRARETSSQGAAADRSARLAEIAAYEPPEIGGPPAGLVPSDTSATGPDALAPTLTAPPTEPPTAAAPQGPVDPIAMLGPLMGTRQMSEKLVGSTLARGERPTSFDYAGLLI